MMTRKRINSLRAKPTQLYEDLPKIRLRCGRRGADNEYVSMTDSNHAFRPVAGSAAHPLCGPAEATPRPPEDLFEIVVVCTGNQFRSPIVAGLIRSAASHLPVLVTSLGTMKLPPVHALPEAVALGAELGVDLSGHRARSMRNMDLSSADLVVGFEFQHVAAAVVDAGARAERTFTALELVHLLEGQRVPPGADIVSHARRMVALADARRIPAAAPTSAFQIHDPVEAGPAGHRAVVAQLEAASERLLEGLFGASLRPVPPQIVAEDAWVAAR
jgi:protein-tyrosine-phosphatase